MSAFFLLGIMQLYEGTLHLVVAAIVSYLLVYMRIGGRFMPWIVCVLAMAHMLYTHLVRELNHVPLTTIEISAMHMVLVMNITSFAWNCYDGQMRPPEACEELQRRARIVRMPSLLEYFGYWCVQVCRLTKLLLPWGARGSIDAVCRLQGVGGKPTLPAAHGAAARSSERRHRQYRLCRVCTCLLYTSDAADE